MAKPVPNGKIRCAIYTRKSTEEGLEQEFNSLDAQREACAAYILSQRHEGWTLVPEFYDDGGYSGGNMERPGLKQLLADVALGKVDVIVVYKVDRLTRSLADFSKIVDVLEKADASFVSVTQAFNTTTSMGRLMLNVLLSFAQFEREVTGERIRDKVAASKRKGMWMGGPVPLGYDLVNRKLIPNEIEAATVRLIFERYLDIRSIGALAVDLNLRGVRSKRRDYANGRNCGGVAYSGGALSHMLRNPLYIGEVRHKGERFPGEHPAILDRDMFEKVQALLDGQRNNASARWSAEHASPLVGWLSDGESRAMTTSHATKRTQRYRYYITRRPFGEPVCQRLWRVPAIEVEQAVAAGLAKWLRHDAATELAGDDASLLMQVGAAASVKAEALSSMPSEELRALLDQLDAKVRLATDAVTITIADAPRALNLPELNQPGAITICMPAAFVRRGHELRLIITNDQGHSPARIDSKLIKLLVEAKRAYAILTSRTDLDRVRRQRIGRHARLTFLAPDIVSRIIQGHQPPTLTARHLMRFPDLPIEWDQQRRLLGF